MILQVNSLKPWVSWICCCGVIFFHPRHFRSWGEYVLGIDWWPSRPSKSKIFKECFLGGGFRYVLFSPLITWENDPQFFTHFFPKDVSSQGSSEDCWRISHHTYPTHISHHTYPTHIHHTTHIPHISIQNVSHQYVSHQYVSVQHVSHQYVSMQCVSIQNVCISRFCNTYPTNTYPTNTYPTNTYPTNTYPCYAYPFNAYPFKRCASAGIANVSHQYISHQYVSSTRIPPVRIHSMRIHSKSLHQQEWQWVWASLHIISYHCYSAGMVMNIETLLFLQFLCKIINWI